MVLGSIRAPSKLFNRPCHSNIRSVSVYWKTIEDKKLPKLCCFTRVNKHCLRDKITDGPGYWPFSRLAYLSCNGLHFNATAQVLTATVVFHWWHKDP